ncbi:FtsW/RodA/SpoVE family cell cycle protein [Treponema endosymbiont of Eucomonympha sp.]|uniref:FtsW/RodA/SpoVE family cell cycle protein n=1 Tax=Treponema endosymbiont of Eucomonympha sp. TaxID=1580831 RepID=UPI000A5E504F|nr:FtsW/RodA/SpoVE family cell cycle protein [Treponema endosymbiont of Eucomonympha sp.]
MFNVRVTTEIPAERSGHIDTAFLISVILLWGFGTVTLFITSTNVAVRIFDDALYFVKRQMLYSIAGFALMTLFAVFPLETLRRVLPDNTPLPFSIHAA